MDVFKEKLVRRDISMKAFDANEPPNQQQDLPPGHGNLKQGHRPRTPRRSTRSSGTGEGPKGVKTQVQGDEIRVSSKKRDDLQAIIALLKGSDLDVALQFVNYR